MNQHLSMQQGKHRHVSKNTVTISRMRNGVPVESHVPVIVENTQTSAPHKKRGMFRFLREWYNRLFGRGWYVQG